MPPSRTIDDVLRDVFSFERVLADYKLGGSSAVEKTVFAEDPKKNYSGSISRIRRGDSPITRARAERLTRSVIGLGFRYHPLFEILRNPQMNEDALRRVLWALAPALSVQMFDLTNHQGRITTVRREVSTEVCDALCLQADHYALAALLAIVLEARALGCVELAFHATVRAAQCFAFASVGELSVIRFPLLARMRQQVLDSAKFCGKRWAFEDFDFEGIRSDLCRLLALDGLAYQGTDGSVVSVLQRRSLNLNSYLVLLPNLVSTRRAIRAPHGLPLIVMKSRILAGGGPPARFGSKALKIIRRDLEQYWPG